MMQVVLSAVLKAFIIALRPMENSFWANGIILYCGTSSGHWEKLAHHHIPSPGSRIEPWIQYALVARCQLYSLY